MEFREVFEKVYNRRDLSFEESRQSVFAMMEGSWEPTQISALLVALHLKGETADELAGFATAMSEKAVRVPVNGIRAMDTCGTGGDKKGSFNISTLAAFVLAGCGIPIVKHGNRAASSQCGSADLMQSLGMRYRLQPEEAAEALRHTGFAFLFAPDYHPATKAVVAIRKQLSMPTIFNLLGPLTNPAQPAAQLIGVYDPHVLAIMVAAIRKMDIQKRAMLLHAEEGFDEATTCCKFVCHSTYGEPETLGAEQFGFEHSVGDDLQGGSPGENVKIALAILEGERGAKRETVLLNALLGYRVYHPSASIEEARQAVEESLDSRAAMNVVQKYKRKFPVES